MPVLLQILIGLEIAGVIIAAFLYLPALKTFKDPEAARIVVFHVPCAMIAVLAYVVSMIYAIAYLASPSMVKDAKSAISAELGFLFTALATITGAIFAKVEWGMAWNWDPRETTILMLIIVYAAYFALRGAIPARMTRAKISAAYNILAGIIMPYLVFVLPRMLMGLHPNTTLTQSGGLGTPYRIVLMSAMAGFVGIYIWIFRLQVRVAEHELSRRRK